MPHDHEEANLKAAKSAAKPSKNRNTPYAVKTFGANFITVCSVGTATKILSPSRLENLHSSKKKKDQDDFAPFLGTTHSGFCYRFCSPAEPARAGWKMARLTSADMQRAGQDL